MRHPVGDANVDSIFGKYSPEEFYALHGVIHSEGYLVNPKGIRLYTHSWKPVEGEVKGLLFVCHGYGSDSSWLVQLTAICFAEGGYFVHAIDHQGHGKSGGLLGYVPSVDSLTDDSITFFDSVRKDNPSLPAFLYGESMGGAIILFMTLRQPNVYKGMLLNGAMLKISEKYKPPWPLESILSYVAMIPGFQQLPIVPTRDIPTISFKEKWKRTLARANPGRYGGKPYIGTALAMLKAVSQVETRMPEVTIPFIVVHGKLDVVTDPAGSEDLFKRSASTDKTIHLYDDMWHQLVGETPDNIDQVFGDLLSWLNERVK